MLQSSEHLRGVAERAPPASSQLNHQRSIKEQSNVIQSRHLHSSNTEYRDLLINELIIALALPQITLYMRQEGEKQALTLKVSKFR